MLQFETKPIAICRSSKNNTTALQPTATASKRRLHVFQILRCKGATTSVAERKYRKNDCLQCLQCLQLNRWPTSA